jgi:hypothetical protein
MVLSMTMLTLIAPQRGICGKRRRIIFCKPAARRGSILSAAGGRVSLPPDFGRYCGAIAQR